MPAMAAETTSTSSSSRPGPGVAQALGRFWHRVTEGLELQQLWSQFFKDAKASYRLYERDVDARATREERKHTFWTTLQAFAWAMLEKLSPARRVLLLLGVVLLLLPGGGFRYSEGSGAERAVEFDFHFHAGVILFVLLMLEVADRVVMKRDLEIARDIQKWLLPATAPEVPGLKIAFATRAANTVAGDFYDVFARPAAEGDARYLLAVADVAGKSIPAALLMATFQASLRTLSTTGCSLLDLVAGMNHYACTNSQSGVRFTTAFLAEYEPATRALTYVNAGHNHPILRRASGAVERLETGGLPLGIQESPYQAGVTALAAGDWLMIFTDGLVEAENDRGEEYGEARILQLLQNWTGSLPDDLLRRMIDDVNGFAGTAPQHDDITCMLVKVE